MASFHVLEAQYLLAVREGSRYQQEAVINALRWIARSGKPLPAWALQLGIQPATPPPPDATTDGPPLAGLLERAIEDARSQRDLTPAAFGTLGDEALDGALGLDPALHAAAAATLARLTAAAKALRAPGAPSAAWLAWRAKADVLEPAIARARAASPTPLALIAGLYQALGAEPPLDDGGATEHAEALAAAVALLG